MILAIDPATKCGWCVMNEAGHVVESGTWDLFQPILSVRRGTLFLRLGAKLRELLTSDGFETIGTIAYERVFQHTSEAQDRIYGGLVGKLEEIAAEYELDTAGIAVSTAKKHATGHGNAKKPEMLAAAQKRWGDSIVDDNQADACWIADAARVGLHRKAKEAKKKGRKTA